jgi:phosphoglycolate phosphatase-like HAD superfamily hydrolase
MDSTIVTMSNSSRATTVALLQRASIVFWDFDGVIKDSVAAKSDGYEQLFMSYGKEVAGRVRKHHEAHGGVSRYEKIPIYLNWAGESGTVARVQEFCDRFSKLVRQAVINSPWVPGVREYLQEHCARQRFVLLTATPQEEIQEILHELDIAHCFDFLCGAPTPKADAIADILRSLLYSVEAALVIGDSESDLAAAEANGVAFLLRCTAINQALQNRYPGPMFDDLAYE